MKHIIPILLLAIMLYETAASIVWMHYNASCLAPCQALRQEAGEWLHENASDEWIVSSDIGAISYYAPNCNIIDINGLCSADVLGAYQLNVPLDKILNKKNPKYIADTFTIVEGSLQYNHPQVMEYLKNKQLVLRTVKLFNQDVAMAIIEIIYKRKLLESQPIGGQNE